MALSSVRGSFVVFRNRFSLGEQWLLDSLPAPLPAIVTALAFADLDGNGWLDGVAASPAGVMLWYNGGGLTYTWAPVLVYPGVGPHSGLAPLKAGRGSAAAVAFTTRTGDSGSTERAVVLRRGAAPAGVSARLPPAVAWQTIAAEVEPWSLASADFDGDGCVRCAAHFPRRNSASRSMHVLAPPSCVPDVCVLSYECFFRGGKRVSFPEHKQPTPPSRGCAFCWMGPCACVRCLAGGRTWL